MNPQDLIVSDNLGNDPLRHRILSQLSNIRNFSNIDLPPEYESNPALLAHDVYGDVELFYVILAFNGISDGMSLSAGQSLRIPDRNQVLALVRTNNQRRRNVTI